MISYQEILKSPILDSKSQDYIYLMKELNYHDEDLKDPEYYNTIHSAFVPIYEKLPSVALNIFKEWLDDTQSHGAEDFQMPALYLPFKLSDSFKQLLSQQLNILTVTYNYRPNNYSKAFSKSNTAQNIKYQSILYPGNTRSKRQYTRRPKFRFYHEAALHYFTTINNFGNYHGENQEDQDQSDIKD